MTMKVILPDTAFFDTARIIKAISNGLTGAAKGAQVDFKVTAKTWKHKVVFEIIKVNDFNQVIGTDDEIYGWVNDGTPAHKIFPRPSTEKRSVLVFSVGGGPKTMPGVIGSSAGRPGNTFVFTPRGVNHPGTKARDFDEVIQDKWDEQLPILIQRAIDSEFS